MIVVVVVMKTLLRANRPNLRGLWAKYDVPYVIGEEVFDIKTYIM